MRPTILLFEDDPDIRRLVIDLLGEEGYDVYPVFSLGQAARIAQSVRFDLFLADSDVPVKEVAMERLRLWCEHTDGQVPVIAFTAHNISREEARSLGCADAVPKPFDVDELLSRIEGCVRKRRVTGVGTVLDPCN